MFQGKLAPFFGVISTGSLLSALALRNRTKISTRSGDLPPLSFSLFVGLASLLEVRGLLHENEAGDGDGGEDEFLGVHV